jgi:transcription-repair coupling factor (superfamily II helicase)
MEDRFGHLPPEGERLLDAAKVRLISERLGITQIDHRAGVLTMKFSEASPLDPSRLLAWVKGHPGASLLPTGVLRAPAPWEPPERVSRTLAALRDLG